MTKSDKILHYIATAENVTFAGASCVVANSNEFSATLEHLQQNCTLHEATMFAETEKYK